MLLPRQLLVTSVVALLSEGRPAKVRPSGGWMGGDGESGCRHVSFSSCERSLAATETLGRFEPRLGGQPDHRRGLSRCGPPVGASQQSPPLLNWAAALNSSWSSTPSAVN